jgi:hypothetical protein
LGRELRQEQLITTTPFFLTFFNFLKSGKYVSLFLGFSLIRNPREGKAVGGSLVHCGPETGLIWCWFCVYLVIAIGLLL